ncbi:Probable outer membrane component of multidrug efflux pump [hydrothermal vent metagenome]|uniref:Probable outer membrane component of multidrug efflux pump n=1 Tax=hydrothermal vent metagenome TaxID=652676 RepID=A0A1W1BGM1_9ZZZZ
MRRIVFVFFVPFFLFAQSYSLKTLIIHAQKNNGLMKEKVLNIQSKEKEIEAVKSAYWPTVDVGADYSFQSPKYVVSPGRTGNVFISAKLNLYDGGRKEAVLRGKGFEHEASLFEKTAFEKSMTLRIVRYYYAAKQYAATLKALKVRSEELKAQIVRIKKFKLTGLATQEEVDKLQSAYDNNQYMIENTTLAVESSEENLKLISGLSAKYLRRNYFMEPGNVHFEWFENIKILQANAHSIDENAKAIDAGYLPQVNLSDTYHRSHFNDLVSIPGVGADSFLMNHQNKVEISINMRIFDHGKMAKESEAVKYRRLALVSRIAQAKKEQKMNFKLAKKGLNTTKEKIKSAKSALKAATSTYKVLKQKFEAGLVDDIAYLDALTQMTLAKASYKETVYDYEVKKSIYYYYAGKDPKEFIK